MLINWSSEASGGLHLHQALLDLLCSVSWRKLHFISSTWIQFSSGASCTLPLLCGYNSPVARLALYLAHLATILQWPELHFLSTWQWQRTCEQMSKEASTMLSDTPVGIFSSINVLVELGKTTSLSQRPSQPVKTTSPTKRRGGQFKKEI